MTLRYPPSYQAPHAAVVRVQIRRETLLEDGIRQLNNIGGDMKRKVQVRHGVCLGVVSGYLGVIVSQPASQSPPTLQPPTLPHSL